MKRMVALFSWIIALGLITGACFAQPQRGGKSGRNMMSRAGNKGARGGGESRLIKKLVQDKELAEEVGLEEEQVDKLSEGLYEIERKNVELKADLQLAGLEQAKLMMQEEVNEKEVMEAVEKAGQARTELAKLKVKQMLLVKQTLSEDQLSELKEVMRRKRQEMRERMRDRRSEQKRDKERDKSMKRRLKRDKN